MTEHDMYSILTRSALREGWTLYVIEDGGVNRRPADMFGNMYGAPILLEAKHYTQRNYAGYHNKRVQKLSLFEPHQITALDMWESNGGSSMAVAVALSDYDDGEYHIWVNNITKLRVPDFVAKTIRIKTGLAENSAIDKSKSFFEQKYMRPVAEEKTYTYIEHLQFALTVARLVSSGTAINVRDFKRELLDMYIYSTVKRETMGADKTLYEMGLRK